MKLSSGEAEIFFNGICFGVAILIGGFAIVMYRAWQPKFYGLLIWALFLILGAALTFGLYSSLLESFLAMKSIDKNVLVVRDRLAENVRLLAFVIPGLMLAVAANLITTFMQTPSPEKSSK
jgi:hypothetical protein